MDRKVSRAYRIASFCGIALWLAASPVLAAVPPFDQPNWAALTAGQKATLAPLADQWNTMDSFRRKKWLGIAQRYPAMSPEEQASMQRNMKEWAKLAPEERKQAREQYKTLKKVSPEQREIVRQKWDEYTALTPEERDRLKVEGSRSVPLKTLSKPETTPPASTSNSKKQIHAPLNSPLSPLKPPQSPLVPKAAVAKPAPRKE